MLGLAAGGYVLSDAFRVRGAATISTPRCRSISTADRRRRTRSERRRRAAGALPQPPLRSASIPACIGRSCRGRRRQAADFPFAVRPHDQVRRCASGSRRLRLGPCRRARTTNICACCRAASSFRSPPRPIRTTAAPIPSWSRATCPRSIAEIAEFNETLIWSFVVLGLGLDPGDLHPGARRPAAAAARDARRLARIRERRGAAAGRKFSRRDRAAGRRTQQPDRAFRRSGGPRPHPCFQPGAFPEDAARPCLASEAEADPGPLADAVKRQVDVMRRQVDHYLARARAAGALDVLGNRTPVAPVLEDLARVLRRIHAAARHRDRGRLSAGARLSRRASGPGGDGRQSDGQCLQMGRGARPRDG